MEKQHQKFSLYFSHSWDASHVDLNLYVWKQVSANCNLLVDQPDDDAIAPPYYVNRLEELMRRADLFIAVLPYREPKEVSTAANRRTDLSIKCSPGSLFEIRLAERSNKPRLVIYDIRTGFVPPKVSGKNTSYIKFNFEDILDKIKDENDVESLSDLSAIIDEWLQQANKKLSPKGIQQETNSYILLPGRLSNKKEAFDVIEQSLADAGYERPLDLSEALSNDAELTKVLSQGGLLIADVSCLEEFNIYCFAHAMFIPTIRLLYSGKIDLDDSPATHELPWVLKGHPGGYQHDIIRWTQTDELKIPIIDRAKAMLQKVKNIFKYNDGEGLFKSRLYGKHSVFISHHQSQKDRALVDKIQKELREKWIVSWEYLVENRAGEDWRSQLNKRLDMATHVVFLFTDDYEHSEFCTHEVEYAIEKGKAIIPFLVGGRVAPYVKLPGMHQQPLRDDVNSNATTVVKVIEEKLLADNKV